jgi:hypothetical protein
MFQGHPLAFTSAELHPTLKRLSTKCQRYGRGLLFDV